MGLELMLSIVPRLAVPPAPSMVGRRERVGLVGCGSAPTGAMVRLNLWWSVISLPCSSNWRTVYISKCFLAQLETLTMAVM